MKLELKRLVKTQKSTIGELFVNGVFECYTLEDVVREPKKRTNVLKWKIKGKTAIPVGVYNVIITMSNRFKKELPLLENVEGFEGVRIHPGNTDQDTEGCILVGTQKYENYIGNSRGAFYPLLAKIQAALANKELVTLTIG